MNICFVTNSCFGPQQGGVQSVCHNLSKELLRLGKHSVFNLSFHHKSSQEQAEIVYGTIPPIKSKRAVESVKRFLQDNSIHILWLHTPSPELCKLMYEATEGCGVKIVSIYHSSPYSTLLELGDRIALAYYNFAHGKNYIELPFSLLKYPFSWLRARNKTKKMLQSMADYSDVTCLLSEYYIREFYDFTPKMPAIVKAFPNPLQKKEDACNVPQKKNQVLIACRLEWKNKRLDRALKIWKETEARMEGWELVILGRGPAYNDYITLAQELKLQRVRFEGMVVPDVYYRESKIILMTSSFEGLPMTLLEAQQYGCVPIAYESFSALADIIDDGKTGYKIPPYDSRLFSEKLLCLMRDEEKREQMSRNCIAHADKFCVEHVTKQWLHLFEELLSQKRSRLFVH